MCFILHLASRRRVPRVAWDEKDRRLNIGEIHGDPEAVRAHFTLPEVAYVGSSLGCGCGFRSVSFQGGDWPEEGLIALGEAEPPEDHLRDHQELHDLVVSLLDEGGRVELYGCWDGDEREAAAHAVEIPATRLLEGDFWFRERALYGIRRDFGDAAAAGGSGRP
jgi:hypothetical protein